MNVFTKGSIVAASVASLLALSTPASFATGNMTGQPKAEINSLTDIAGDNQLEMAVTNDLRQIGIDYPHPEKLTLSQLSELKAIFDSRSANALRQQEARKVLNM